MQIYWISNIILSFLNENFLRGKKEFLEDFMRSSCSRVVRMNFEIILVQQIYL